MLAAANRRTEALLLSTSQYVAAQLSIKHKEACFQKALKEELSITFPVETEVACPVVFTRSDGRKVSLSNERIDLLITSKSRAWAAIVEIKRGLNTLPAALTQVTRYRENYRNTYAAPLAGTFLIIFYGTPTQFKLVNCTLLK